MRICHIALQGCLRLANVSYGITADTGGHIKYLLELVRASAADPDVTHIDIVTRGFDNDKLGEAYAPDAGEVSGKLRLIRLQDGEAAYLPKEQLWQQHQALCDAFLAFLASCGELPDLIHAHYADGGILARAAKERFGIPYIFTGHSLGAVKRQASQGVSDEEIERRIAIEERVLEAADAVIASSRDEAEAQYSHYDGIDSGRIRVIPPGCVLDRFEDATPSDTVRGELQRFLREPEKPILLAIARPVRKKNLMALLEAYAGNAHLRKQANLVIVAGCRGLMGDLEQECREVIEELIAAIDRHDLYGSVAYPKSHAPSDIPAYYALARETGGVFVNPALNEPFGLTLLEAAAAGLPVVATDSGGPNDIIERCGNGLLVCPTDRAGIAAACLDILSDQDKWMRYAEAGSEAVREYDWQAHRAIYHRLIKEITLPEIAPSAHDRLLVCDIDNTLLGDRAALREFLSWQQDHRQNVVLGIATGRSFHSAQAILAAENVPTPDVIISSVGSCVHWYDRDMRRFVEDAAWSNSLLRNWDPDALANLAVALGLEPQGFLEQKPGKASFFVGKADVNTLAEDLRRNGFAGETVISHGRYVDLLARGSGKGAAVEYVAQILGLEPNQVVVAGDSGNDIAMLRACRHPIIVGNASDGIRDHPALAHAYTARATHAAGILEGVQHFRKAGLW